MFERFTAEARSTVVRAQEHAIARRDPSITPTHLLLALSEGSLHDLLAASGVDVETVERFARQPTSSSVDDDAALRTIGVDLRAVRDAVESVFGPGALEAAGSRDRRRQPSGRLAGWRARGGSRHKPFTAAAKQALDLSLRETIRLGGREIAAESLMLGLMRAGDPQLAALFESAPLRQTTLRAALEARIRSAA